MKRKGFTLIELLVVISIIALLLAILMPALGLVKEKARVVVCQTNQKNLILAWKLYAEDNGGKLVGSYNNLINGYPGWADSPANQTLEEKIEACKRGMLYPYMETVDVYNCPADKRDFDRNQNAWRTYTIFDCYNGGSWANIKYVNETDISTPSNKMVFLEEFDPRGWNMNSWIISDPTNLNDFRWIDGIGVYHRDISTFSYADGHVEPHKWQDDRTMELFEDMKALKSVPGSSMPTHQDSVDVIYIKQAWNR